MAFDFAHRNELVTLESFRSTVLETYFMNEKLKRNAQKIEYVLLNMQKTLYRINQDHLYKGYKGYNSFNRKRGS